MSDCTNCGHPLDWHGLNPRNDAGVCFGEGPKGAGRCECVEVGVAVPETAETVPPPDWFGGEDQ